MYNGKLFLLLGWPFLSRNASHCKVCLVGVLEPSIILHHLHQRRELPSSHRIVDFSFSGHFKDISYTSHLKAEAQSSLSALETGVAISPQDRFSFHHC